MKYNKFEDEAIQILRKHIADEYRRPKWGQIVDLMNSHRAALNASKRSEYTVSMLRNRHQRMTSLTHGKSKRNVCGKCGLLMRGHTCLGGCTEEDLDMIYNLLLGSNKPITEQDENDEELPSECDLEISQATATALLQKKLTEKEPITEHDEDDEELSSNYALKIPQTKAVEPLEKGWTEVWIDDTESAISQNTEMEAQMQALESMLYVPFLGTVHTDRMSGRAVDTNDACELSFDTSTNKEELRDLLELFRSYDERPEPIEDYQVAWDNV